MAIPSFPEVNDEDRASTFRFGAGDGAQFEADAQDAKEAAEATYDRATHEPNKERGEWWNPLSRSSAIQDGDPKALLGRVAQFVVDVATRVSGGTGNTLPLFRRASQPVSTLARSCLGAARKVHDMCKNALASLSMGGAIAFISLAGALSVLARRLNALATQVVSAALCRLTETVILLALIAIAAAILYGVPILTDSPQRVDLAVVLTFLTGAALIFGS